MLVTSLVPFLDLTFIAEDEIRLGMPACKPPSSRFLFSSLNSSRLTRGLVFATGGETRLFVSACISFVFQFLHPSVDVLHSQSKVKFGCLYQHVYLFLFHASALSSQELEWNLGFDKRERLCSVLILNILSYCLSDGSSRSIFNHNLKNFMSDL
ncbi:hypothetical protein Pfo_007810 [Paulownia fortunei]|nr:hypothetical protein Pfo_007810 [Paulownia fortunei]